MTKVLSVASLFIPTKETTPLEKNCHSRITVNNLCTNTHTRQALLTIEGFLLPDEEEWEILFPLRRLEGELFAPFMTSIPLARRKTCHLLLYVPPFTENFQTFTWPLGPPQIVIRVCSHLRRQITQLLWPKEIMIRNRNELSIRCNIQEII